MTLEQQKMVERAYSALHSELVSKPGMLAHVGTLMNIIKTLELSNKTGEVLERSNNKENNS